MLKAFRILSIVEGLSFIILFAIAMPAKYQFDLDLVRIVGPLHGALWVAFLLMLEMVTRQENWSRSFWGYAFITSILPFGCFFLEKKLKSDAYAIR